MSYVRLYQYDSHVLTHVFIAEGERALDWNLNQQIKLWKQPTAWFADHLWEFGDYSLLWRNCEDFAIFCKTTKMDLQAVQQLSNKDILSEDTRGNSNQSSVVQKLFLTQRTGFQRGCLRVRRKQHDKFLKVSRCTATIVWAFAAESIFYYTCKLICHLI